MIINTLKLEYFRQHRDLTVNFTTGINTIRAANEGGKSTLLESIAYALFGAHALRTPLEDVVTWGENLKNLRVTLSLTLDGHNVTFSRAKSGAEVQIDGKVHVTGQNEVTAYAASMLGADVKAASKLMFASQNGLRGALEEGPKALSVLIEQLADMDVFDKILEAAQEKLALGSPALLEERLKGATATLAAATEALPPKPDDAAYVERHDTLASSIVTGEQSLVDINAAIEVAEQKWIDASALRTKRVTLETAVENAEENLDRAQKQVKDLEPAATTIVTDSREALKAQIATAEDYDKRVVAYRIFRNLPDEERFVGNAEAFEAAFETSTATLANIEMAIRDTERAIEKAKARRINHEKCDKCGQDVTHLETVIATNAEVDAEVAKLEPQLAKQMEDRTVEKICNDRLKSIQRYASKMRGELDKIAAYVDRNDTVYPAEVQWVAGDMTGEAPDVAALKRRLTAHEAEIKAVETAKAKLELAIEQVATAAVKVADAKAALESFHCPTAEEFVTLTETKDEIVLSGAKVRGEIVEKQQELEKLKTDHAHAQQLWASGQQRINDATATIEACNKDLESLSFNNGLVKKIRNLRPVVADKMWNTVLSSVSVMFTQMRGEPSLVTKGKDGFRVNEQAVESFSGSTLDILGVAIRAALLRTFIPHNTLLVLDEPAQGCDSERTESLLGFLHTLGMGQTLLVTHESVSEAVADNIINL